MVARFRNYAFCGMLAAGLVAASLTFGAGATLAKSDTATPAPSPIVSLPSLAPLVKKVMPAVVNISAQEKPPAATGKSGHSADPGHAPSGQNSPFDQLLRRFFHQQMPGLGERQQDLERVALGSGFIIDPRGYVVTNNHVVVDASKVTVIFQDGSRHVAKVIGRDPKTDLALLKIKTKKPLPYVKWGDSNAAQVGDWVLAVGNPFGLGGTVSSGIISARGRDIHSGPYDDFLQLDASINRGNSGGPTFNLRGRVIGINTAIYSPNGGSVGIGFAIPSSLARPVIAQLMAHGKVNRGWLGVEIQEVTPEIAKSLGMREAEGALIADVTNDGPASKSGFRQGDVILSFDGHHIAHVRDLPIIVAETSIGQKANVKILRNGKDITLHPVIAEMPANLKMVSSAPKPAPEKKPGHVSALGLKLAPLDAEWRQRLHIADSIHGVVVTGVKANSPFAREGLQPGDVIESIDQKPVHSPAEAAAHLKAARAGKNKSVLLLINRNGSNAYVAVAMGK
ncbi:MAG: DegQ family serine endoprotease, partial [Stellaceae bacterium]